MPRFTNGKTEIETSNQVEIVRLRASGYLPADAKASQPTDRDQPHDEQPTGGEQSKGRGRGRA